VHVNFLRAPARHGDLIQAQDSYQLARRAAVFGLFAAFLSGTGQTFFIGLFGAHFRSAFALGEGGFGAMYGLATLIAGLSMFWLGGLADRLHPRNAISVSLALLAAGAACVAVAPVTLVLFGGIFLLRLGGQGLTGHIAIVAAARHGGARRGRMVAVAVFGFILAEATLPLLVATLPALDHWRWTWSLVAVLLLVGAVPAMRRLAAPLPLQPPAEKTPAGAARAPGRRALLRDPLFLAALLIVLTTPFVVTAIFLHQGTIAEIRGWRPAEVALGFLLFAVSQVGSIWLAGAWIDKFGSFSLMRIYLLPAALGLLALAVIDGRAALWLMFGGLGLSAGANGVVAGAVWVEAFGTRRLGMVRGVYAALMVISTAVSPALLGIGIAAGASIPVLAIGAAVYAAAVPPLAVARINRARRDPNRSSDPGRGPGDPA
jgi:MFS family permease